MRPERGSVRSAVLPQHKERSGWSAVLAGWALLLALIGGLVLLLPPGLPRPGPAATLMGLGVIGIWRWSWGALHLARALLFRRLVFPRIRRRAEAAPAPPALYMLVTSYRMTASLNAAVYGGLFGEIARFGVPTLVVACVTDHADAMVIEQAFNKQPLPEGTRVEIIAQRGRGKRDAMAAALDRIAAAHPPAGAQVVLMDGDTLLSADALKRTCAVLSAEPRVGAVTTDNVPLVQGSAFTREWYRLRMAHRDSLMCSMALSRRILVLTGRFSVFRAELATSNGFIKAVADDHVDHGRLGRIRMLTGDDKSTWFETLRGGWDMLYVPDVAIHPVEELPAGGFRRATTALMLRWYGNMARNNGRAIRLGPSRCGWFAWVALLDQRYSMWTSLVGPSTALVLAATRHGSVLVAYLLWVVLSRALVCVLFWIVTGRFHPMFVPALYYNQVVGSLVKILAFHHPDRQRWTRQSADTAWTGRPGFGARLSTPTMAATAGLFLLGSVVLAGTLDLGHRPRHGWSVGDALFAPARPRPPVHALGH